MYEVKGKRKKLWEGGKVKNKGRRGEKKTFEWFGLLVVNWKFLFIFPPIFHSKRSWCIAVLSQTYVSNTNVFFIKGEKNSCFIIKEWQVKKTHFDKTRPGLWGRAGRSDGFEFCLLTVTVETWRKILIRILLYLLENIRRIDWCINPWKTKRRLLYLKTQSVPRCKQFSSRL